MTQLVLGVHELDERGDGRRARRVMDDCRGQTVERDRCRSRSDDGLDVGRVVARRAADERVLADVHRGEELLGGRAAHRPGHGRHDDVRQPEPIEQRDVRRAMGVVGLLEAGVVEIEAVGVLHHELAAAQQTGSRTGLVAILGLDLVDRQRQVLVRPADVLHEQGEHLLVGRREEEVGALAVLQTEQVVAVLGPPTGRLVRFAGQQGGEVDFLEPGGVHLLADDPFDVAVHDPAERQPGEPTGGRPADVARPHQQAMAGDLGVSGVISQGPQEQRRHPKHPGTVPTGRRPTGLRCDGWRGEGSASDEPGAAADHDGRARRLRRGRCYDYVSIWFGTERRGAEPHALFVERRQFR